MLEKQKIYKITESKWINNGGGQNNFLVGDMKAE